MTAGTLIEHEVISIDIPEHQTRVSYVSPTEHRRQIASVSVRRYARLEVRHCSPNGTVEDITGTGEGNPRRRQSARCGTSFGVIRRRSARGRFTGNRRITSLAAPPLRWNVRAVSVTRLRMRMGARASAGRPYPRYERTRLDRTFGDQVRVMEDVPLHAR